MGLGGAILATLLISLLHKLTSPAQLHWHNVFQHLYYLPTVVAALLYGWRGGLAVGVLAGVTRLPDVLRGSAEMTDYVIEQAIEIPVLCFVGMLAGFFSDRDRRQKRDLQNTTRRLSEVYAELHRNFEQMKRAERLFAVGQLAAGLAHELRNPLAGVAGAAGILERNAHLEARYRECLDIISKETQRLNRLLSEFLDFARPRPPRYQTIEIAPLIDSVIQLATHGIGRQPITVRSEVDPDLPPVEGDPELLKQMLLNLVINAIQAMPQGGEIVVSAWLQEGKTLIRVRDHGCGIAADYRDRIFDPFFTTKDGGTGLGLSVAHQIVDQHGGVLTAEANEDAGTTFSALLPLHPGAVRS